MIKNVVFTGGPCAGKTTIINSIKEILTNEQYLPIIVPETATELITSGIEYNKVNNTLTFQDLILKMQLNKENLYTTGAETIKTNKKVILFDRGTLDNIAYLNNNNEFDILTKNNNVKELELLDKYNLIIDLITTADCKPEVYINDDVRKESKETAIMLDHKTSNAWAGHRNLKIVNSSIPIEEETKLIARYINDLLKNKQTSNKLQFLIDDFNSNFNNYNDNNSRLINITDIFLNGPKPDNEYKLSKRQYKNAETYIYTISKYFNNKEIILYDQLLTKEQFIELINNYNIKDYVEKKELSFIENRQLYQISFYNDKSILTIEPNTLNNNLTIPNNLKIKSNYNLQKKYPNNKKYVNIK